MRAAQPMVPLPYRVARTRRELEATVTLDLAPAGDAAIERPRPGQFDMLYAFGAGEVPISFSAIPGDATLVHTIRAVGAVSRALAELQPGDPVGVRGPFGAPWPVEDLGGRHAIVVAGGIGLAPLRPAIERLLDLRRGDPAGGETSILIGAREPDQLLFPDAFDDWRARGARVLVTVDAASEDWEGSVGVVSDLVSRVRIDPRRTSALVCGPEVMMRFACQALLQAEVPAADVWVSLERNMQCGLGLCGQCQLGESFVCSDGPVFRYADVEDRILVPEV